PALSRRLHVRYCRFIPGLEAGDALAFDVDVDLLRSVRRVHPPAGDDHSGTGMSLFLSKGWKGMRAAASASAAPSSRSSTPTRPITSAPAARPFSAAARAAPPLVGQP